MRCGMHPLLLAGVLASLVAPLAVAEAPPTSPPAVREPVEATTTKVVPLAYARASELAHTLALVFPHVRVVPYHPTNSLIISGPRASVEELIDIIGPANRD
jgi:type II secretory pathway component GspD/PulD (secretin)